MEYLIPALLVVFVTAIVLYLRWLRKNDDYFEKRGIPYSPRQGLLAFIKNFTDKSIHELLIESHRKLGRIYGGFELRNPILTVSDPDLLRDILVKDFNLFHYRRDMNFGDSILNKMVNILKGDDWKRVRTIITPAFTSKRMRQMSQIINECSLTTVRTLEKYADKEEPADFRSIFGAFTMDVIASSAFGTKIDSHDDPDNIFVRKVKEAFAEPSIFQILILFVIPPWITSKLKMKFIESTDFFKDVILQVIKERRETGKRYNDFLQLLMDAKDELKSEDSKLLKPEEDETDRFGSVINCDIFRQKYKTISEDELVAQCVLFFIVGYETTASALSFMSYLLALHPECQDKLIAEVDEVFKKHSELNYDVIKDMKYLDYALSETLRLYPSLTRSERTAIEDYKLGNTGITIEKGRVVGFNIQAMHLDPEFFPDPEKFDPERFTDENANHPQYAYLPFGAGPRNCLGMRFAIMEIKLCISNILRYYRFKRAPTTKVPLEFKKGQGLLGIHELPLLVERRYLKKISLSKVGTQFKTDKYVNK